MGNYWKSSLQKNFNAVCLQYWMRSGYVGCRCFIYVASATSTRQKTISQATAARDTVDIVMYLQGASLPTPTAHTIHYKCSKKVLDIGNISL